VASPDTKALSIATMSCVRVSSESLLVELVLVDAALELTVLVEVV
jgi:hypothetical protein